MTLTISSANKVRPLDGAIVRTFELEGTADYGDVVYIDGNDKVQLARTNAAATAKGFGVVVAGSGHLPDSSPVDGDIVGVCVWGPIAGITGMDPTKGVYVSSGTAGDMTQTAPSGAGTWTQTIGYPLRSDVLMVAPSSASPTSNT